MLGYGAEPRELVFNPYKTTLGGPGTSSDALPDLKTMGPRPRLKNYDAF